jgi:prepilin-type processing-associated H-X9-DG protein
LDRAPEVKTLRRKFTRLAELGRATDLGRELAKRRVALRGDVMGVLYVDGHVRVYHGKHVLPKAHVAQMRLSMPATTEYWVNDRRGDPVGRPYCLPETGTYHGGLPSDGGGTTTSGFLANH